MAGYRGRIRADDRARHDQIVAATEARYEADAVYWFDQWHNHNDEKKRETARQALRAMGIVVYRKKKKPKQQKTEPSPAGSCHPTSTPGDNP